MGARPHHLVEQCALLLSVDGEQASASGDVGRGAMAGDHEHAVVPPQQVEREEACVLAVAAIHRVAARDRQMALADASEQWAERTNQLLVRTGAGGLGARLGLAAFPVLASLSPVEVRHRGLYRGNGELQILASLERREAAGRAGGNGESQGQHGGDEHRPPANAGP
ncbi:hypothetical protein [Archangium lipolyticum]|uniref:hypothetical protein n=1 Tax=Archangium lipolyticum TaxID=2970465 RepID=UPI00214A40EE|nr:hypothetical protein [Archangium lipolyticum]